MLPGVFIAKTQKNTTYFRSSITYKQKHISLGSYQTEEAAHNAYLIAADILNTDNALSSMLAEKALISILGHERIVSLANFRDNNVYFKNPIYLMKKYFHYYLTPDQVFTFDAEDLFFYANHKIQKRGNRLFTADYGMQLTLGTRYGIKPYAVIGRDYEFINGDTMDYRYENIKLLSHYTGVFPIYNASRNMLVSYKVLIHFKGNYTVGIFSDEDTAAIAYNKAADYINSTPYRKKYNINFIENKTAREYAEIYSQIDISHMIQSFSKRNH